MNPRHEAGSGQDARTPASNGDARPTDAARRRRPFQNEPLTDFSREDEPRSDARRRSTRCAPQLGQTYPLRHRRPARSDAETLDVAQPVAASARSSARVAKATAEQAKQAVARGRRRSTAGATRRVEERAELPRAGPPT